MGGFDHPYHLLRMTDGGSPRTHPCPSSVHGEDRCAKMGKRSDKTNTGEGGKGKKGRTVSDDAGGKSLSDTSTSAGVKSTAIRTSVNIFEASKSDKPQYFVDKVKDKRRTKGNNLEFLIGWRGFPDPNHDTWEPLHHLSGSEHMIREFNQQWEKDYVRKTAETLEAQAARRKSAAEQNAQREDIDEAMGEGGGDEEEDGECEDGYEDGHGSAGAAKRPGTQRRKLRSFYFRTGAVLRMWWKQHQQEFPDLARMARQYLAVPATSASPERFFSRVGLVQTDLRGRLLDTTMIDLMWAKQAP